MTQWPLCGLGRFACEPSGEQVHGGRVGEVGKHGVGELDAEVGAAEPVDGALYVLRVARVDLDEGAHGLAVDALLVPEAQCVQQRGATVGRLASPGT